MLCYIPEVCTALHCSRFGFTHVFGPSLVLVNLASSAGLAGPASPDSSSQFSPFEWIGMEEEKPKD